jgi:pyruvate dehydrogenase E2 component (dihydrolipoamide acetyltransferase)
MTSVSEVLVPDIGDFKDVEIIEIFVAPGDQVNEEDPLIALESDKATLEVPSPTAGTIKALKVSLGDKVSEGTPILSLEQGEPSVPAPPSPEGVQEPDALPIAAPAPPPAPAASAAPTEASADQAAGQVHAGPSVRRLARELDVDLAQVAGSGPKGRILKEDVKAALVGAAAPAAASGGFSLPPIPTIDHASFGEVEVQALSRIKRKSGPHLHACWLNVPHVTQHDEADITDTDAFRKEMDTEAKKDGFRVSLLAFLMKASVVALKQYPEINASLDETNENLVLKRYYNIGIAVDTPGGLVVPVFRDVDRKGIMELGREMSEMSAKARDGKLSPTDMQGGSFTISSLGGIGGTGFTPIVNAPQLAILGVSRAKMQPHWTGEEFVPRLMVPLSLSYDHRVIDGAAAARFTSTLGRVLADVRRLVL